MNIKGRPLESHEIAGAISRWARANGYTSGLSVSTNQISETEIIVEASVNESPMHGINTVDVLTITDDR